MSGQQNCVIHARISIPSRRVSLLMQRDEVYLASFPFGDVPGMKLRPVLLLTHPIGAAAEVLVAYISSVVPPALLPSEIVIDPKTSEGQGRTGRAS